MHMSTGNLGHEGTSTLTMRYGQLSRKLLEIGSGRGSCLGRTQSAAHRPGYPGTPIEHFARQPGRWAGSFARVASNWRL